ncbi:unnamed protein product [Linum trigynum]|uniref:Uncharacterized protein n=1 Tax=Linum trigynum TaxID=586398 RepID=A0AAV2DAC2_9ROSI
MVDPQKQRKPPSTKSSTPPFVISLSLLDSFFLVTADDVDDVAPSDVLMSSPLYLATVGFHFGLWMDKPWHQRIPPSSSPVSGFLSSLHRGRSIRVQSKLPHS